MDDDYWPIQVCRSYVLRLVFISLTLCVVAPHAAFSSEKVHGVSIFGTASLKYAEDEPFFYLNPDAPKYGTFRTDGWAFTKVVPFGIRGQAPLYIEQYCFDTLGIKSWDDDEPYAVYGHVVQYYELSDDKKSMLLHIRPGITFSDGEPLTADDVLFSYRLLYYPGISPRWQVYWKDVETMTKVDEMTVNVIFNEYTPDTPVKMSSLVVYPEHVYGVPGVDLGRDFEDTLPVGSGPYVVERVEPGQRVVFKRKDHYWGDDCPKSAGMWNYDRIELSVYYDDFSKLQALKSGLLDYTGMSLDNYIKLSGPSLDLGYIRKEEFPITRPSAMHAHIFNLRQPLLQDIRIRRVIASLYDFDTINENVHYGTMIRLVSYFHMQERIRASSGPAEGRVREELLRLAEKYNRDDRIFVPMEALTRGPYELGTDAAGNRIPIEERVIAANLYLDQMGWEWDPEVGARRKGDQVLALEILDGEEWLPFFVDRLQQVGIKVTIVKAGRVEKQNRTKSFRFDMMNGWYDGRRAPGRELARHLLSERADIRGSTARMGLKNPAVDEVLHTLMNIESRDEMEIFSKVFDRIMVANTYLVPGVWPKKSRGCFSSKLAGPEKYCSGLWFNYNIMQFWWIDPERAARLEAARKANIPFEE